MTDIIGLLPCGGKATRLLPFKYPKQLLPIAFTFPDKMGNSKPILVAEYSLRAMRKAGIRRCMITINANRLEILKYFENGQIFDMELAYLYESIPVSLPYAIDLAFEWTNKSIVCLAWPDTIFEPFNAVQDLCNELNNTTADIMLGVFPNHDKNQSYPVYYDKDNNVYKVMNKPRYPKKNNTCGLAAWRPSFTQFLHKHTLPSNRNSEQQIMELFDQAMAEGLKVKALAFEDGSYTDLGNPSGIASLILRKNEIEID